MKEWKRQITVWIYFTQIFTMSPCCFDKMPKKKNLNFTCWFYQILNNNNKSFNKNCLSFRCRKPFTCHWIKNHKILLYSGSSIISNTRSTFRVFHQTDAVVIILWLFEPFSVRLHVGVYRSTVIGSVHRVQLFHSFACFDSVVVSVVWMIHELN